VTRALLLWGWGIVWQCWIAWHVIYNRPANIMPVTCDHLVPSRQHITSVNWRRLSYCSIENLRETLLETQTRTSQKDRSWAYLWNPDVFREHELNMRTSTPSLHYTAFLTPLAT